MYKKYICNLQESSASGQLSCDVLEEAFRRGSGVIIKPFYDSEGSMTIIKSCQDKIMRFK